MAGENAYTRFANTLSSTSNNIARNIAQINYEKQELAATSQLTKNKEQFDNLLMDMEENPGDFSTIQQRFNARAKQIQSEGGSALTGPLAQKMYQQATEKQMADYLVKARGLADRLDMANAKQNMGNNLDYMINNIHFDTAGFHDDTSKITTLINSSSLLLPAEKESMIIKYQDVAKSKAVNTGAKVVFDSTPGSFSDKADAARAWLSSPEGASSLGDVNADLFSKVDSMINAWESQEFSRQQRRFDAEDMNLDESVWYSIKIGNLAEAKEKWLGSNFHSEEKNKYWDAYFRSRDKDHPPGDSTAERKAYALATVDDLKEQLNDGSITPQQAINETERLEYQYGNDPGMGQVFRNANDDFKNPNIVENDAFQSGITYLKNMVSSLELNKDHPELSPFIEYTMTQYAKDPNNPDIKDPKVFRRMVDDLLREPVLRKLNDSDTIKSTRMDGWTMNSSEDLTQDFQNGNYRSLIRVDKSGAIDTDFYKQWIRAWGYEEKKGGEYMDVEKVLDTYMKDFKSAADRDFDGGDKVYVDQTTGRPVIEKNGGQYVLQIIDKEEQSRLKDLGINVKRNNEAWYSWNKEKNEFDFFQEVGD